MQKDNIVILYGSSYGTTKKIVRKVSDKLNINSIFNIKNFKKEQLNQYKLLIFFCPTYGDEELQIDMEIFFQSLETSLENKYFLICETGNYYGYDSFELGAKKILLYELEYRQCIQFYKNLSLDTLPRIDWNSLEEWIKGLKGYLNDE